MDTKFDKTIEILFELKVADVMEKNIITISPQKKMEDLKEILKKHKISGLPVVKDDSLVGIISLMDLIMWLDNGKKKCLIEDMMTKKPTCLYTDQPLVHALKKFDNLGYGRCPVVDSDSGKLVGIITKGVIIESTLKELEKEYKEEEVRQYRASHFFGDIIADFKDVTMGFKIVGKDFDNAGKASVTMKRNLKRMGINPEIIKRVSIASYEAEMNLVIYTDGGTMQYNVTEDKITIEVRDNGPGIEDVEKAMLPGYTTAEPWVKELGFGAGMGLPNIKKCTDTMDLDSKIGVGTTLKFELFIKHNDNDVH